MMKILICDDVVSWLSEIHTKVDAFMKDRGIQAEFDLKEDIAPLMSGKVGRYDMAFLDVEMGDFKGTDLAFELKKVNPCIIIFIITAYDKYLDEAMDADAFRFLEKPFDSERFDRSLEKAMAVMKDSVIEFYIPAIKETNEKHRLQRVLSKDIIYIEIDGYKTKVVTTEGEYKCETKMKQWCDCLNGAGFYRCHTSFIINMKYITEYSHDRVILCKKYTIPVAWRKMAQFKTFFMTYYGRR